MAGKPKKLEVRKDLCTLDTFELEGNLEDVIAHLRELDEKYRKTYSEIYMFEDTSYGHHGEVSTIYSLRGTRLETDAEYNKRMEKNKKAAQTKRTNTIARKAEEETEKLRTFLVEAKERGYIPKRVYTPHCYWPF